MTGTDYQQQISIEAINRKTKNKLLAMVKEEIIDGNKLIAEFMGGKKYVLKNHWKGMESYEYENNEDMLAFNIHWDWIMPVVEKIASCLTKDEDVINNGEDSYFDSYYPRTFGMIDAETKEFMVRINRFPLHKSKSLIEATWLSVVEFIKKYNERDGK